MFKNCASKIKAIAKVLFIINAVLTIWGFALLFFFVDDLRVVFVSAVSMPVVLFFAYVACLIMYGFGQIVENTGK